MGITKVSAPQGLQAAVELGRHHEPKVVVEAAIVGRELECGVLQGRDGSPTRASEVGEIQIVLSPISSFPRLVELERRLQGMPVVRTVYARDFRNGVATLAIGLRHPVTADEFAGPVRRQDYPRRASGRAHD